MRALIVIPEFNVEVARGQAILEQAQVTLSELNRFFIVIVDAARSKFPDVNNIVAAFFPLGVLQINVEVLAMIFTTALPLVVDPSLLTADNGTSRPQAADRNIRFCDRPGDRSPGNTCGNRSAGNSPSTGRRSNQWSIRPATPAQPRNQRAESRIERVRCPPPTKWVTGMGMCRTTITLANGTIYYYMRQTALEC
jgi:hypothetical protein